MPRYSPKTHVFDYGGTAPKDRRERYTLDEFCKRMRSRYGAKFRVIPINDALRSGLVINIDGSTVDGVLRTTRGPIAIELLGYSPVDDRGDVMSRDFALRKEIKIRLYNRLKAKRYSLTVWYRDKPRPIPKFGMVRTVPLKQDFNTVIKELRSVVSQAPALELNQFLTIQFIKPDVAKRWGTRQGTLYLDETCYPVCAAHLQHVRLQGLKDYLTPDVESDLKVGFIGIDGQWVREHVAIKARKCLQKSRERANGLPVWLIVHSDGHAIHQKIHETYRSRALELCREVLAETEHGFTRVYWADRTGFLDAAWVGRAL